MLIWLQNAITMPVFAFHTGLSIGTHHLCWQLSCHTPLFGIKSSVEVKLSADATPFLCTW